MNTQAKTERKTISRKALLKSFWDWSFWSHASYNYEKLQSISFAQCMYHVIKDLYPKKEDVSRELEKHTTFFNTEPDVGTLIHGITCAMEEERANTGGVESPVTPESIIAVKTGLMGPFAGIGDSMLQGVFSPVALSICIGIALQGNLFAPILFVLISIFSIVGLSYYLWMYGYHKGKEAVAKVLQGDLMKSVLLAASIVGVMVMGGLVATNVSIYTPLKVLMASSAESGAETNSYLYLQKSFLDALLIGILPLGTTLGIWSLIRKGWSTNKIILIVSVVAFILGALGVISISPPTYM